MPDMKRYKTKYPGVYYIMGKSADGKKDEKIYYIRYRKDGKPIEEKAGRQFQDDMTPYRAERKRTRKIERDELSNEEKREAERLRKEEEAGKWTISKLWKEYKQNKPNLKGLVTDQNRFKNHIEPTFGDKEPNEIVPLDVDRLRIKLLKKKAPGTVKNVLELLRRIINFGINKKLCEGLGFKIELPMVNNLRTEDLTPDQLSKLIDVIKTSTNVQAADMMKMALFTGMRRGEMFKLQWRDINFERGFLNIRDPKGGPDQKIPLNDESRALLSNHPRSRSPFVFPGRKGKQRTDIKHQVNKIKDDAGLPKDFRALHGLRHVYASMLASSGKVDLYTLQKLLTHKSPLMTQRYAHLRDESLKKASDLAGSIIEEATANTEDEKKDKVVNLEDRKK